jgi:TetR/AcrR family transcriptional regulator, transcriptional repressor of bet genes
MVTRNTTEAKYTRLTSEDRRAQLIEVGLACMARGGMRAFTVDKICAEAGVSRGLITHHFGSMNGLLAAVYARIYQDTMPGLTAEGAPGDRLAALIDGLFAPKSFNRDVLNTWVALWGQISNNAALRAEHRRQYSDYLASLTKAIAAQGAACGREVDARTLAKSLICLVDGLSLQHCLDPDVMPAKEASAACRAFLEPHIGLL